ncbi:hypothetical protein [uncultured Clostridium sp.]|uniref:hypothetical protein n=1 Tax=uncultured Clostridium sp. TaxID=59620 RepID=UPI00258FD28A|nr:hypothetical protein [uncultured Clostridium sp.]
MITEALLGLDLLALRFLINYKIEQKKIGSHELKLGYTKGIINRPIIVNMQTTPHLFTVGLSGSGKSKMVEKAIQGKNVILINAFADDFKTVKVLRRINGNTNILNFLNNLLENMKKRPKDIEPLYIVIDELLVLCMDKSITKAITDLLAIGRHYNIYLIGISQQGTKESVKFKDLFNTRVCFRQVEESAYRVVLGYSPENTTLKKREFYLYADYTDKGYTYSIN